MPNRNYEAGRRLEYKTKARFERAGYVVIRASGSHGPYDIVALHPEGTPIVIQCKVVASETTAERLKKKFREEPPFPHNPFFHQELHIQIKGKRMTYTFAGSPESIVNLPRPTPTSCD